jgi:hypothetical protein
MLGEEYKLRHLHSIPANQFVPTKAVTSYNDQEYGRNAIDAILEQIA